MAGRKRDKQDIDQVSYQLVVIIAIALVIGSIYPMSSVNADDPKQPVKIGILTESWGPTPQAAGLRDGLNELGYEEDQDYVLGIRFTRGNHAALPTAVRDLIKLGVDLIMTETDPAIKAAQLATTQIPIVFVSSSDPIGQGFVQSFAHPGGNLTGIADLPLDLGPKRLQLFQEAIPGLRRILFPYDAVDTLLALKEVATYRIAARQLGMELIEKPLRTLAEAQTLFTQLQYGEVDGVLTPRCCSMNIPGFALEMITPKQIPVMFDAAFWVERGGLASYGQSYYESGKQSARIVDKILKGQKPADIPVEVNSKIEFVINLPLAKRLGLAIPPEVLYRADRIIR